MATKKHENSQIDIPKPMISEVDKIVTETGLYTNNIEFVADAVRRLILESRKKEVNVKSNRNDLRTKNGHEIGCVGFKKDIRKPPRMGDI